jgi:hypothetical protein
MEDTFRPSASIELFDNPAKASLFLTVEAEASLFLTVEVQGPRSHPNRQKPIRPVSAVMLKAWARSTTSSSFSHSNCSAIADVVSQTQFDGQQRFGTAVTKAVFLADLSLFSSSFLPKKFLAIRRTRSTAIYQTDRSVPSFSLNFTLPSIETFSLGHCSVGNPACQALMYCLVWCV